MSEWRAVTVGGIARAMATGPFGSSVSSKHFQTDGLPMVRGSNLDLDVGIRLKTDDLVFLPEKMRTEFDRAIARPGDLIFTCWGTIGQIGFVDHSSRFPEYLVSNKQMKLTVDPSVANPLFLYYMLSQGNMIDLVKGQAIGSSVPGFNLGQLRSLPVSLPPLPEQQAIAEVLGALDDKIAANTALAVTADERMRTEYAALGPPSRRIGDVAESPRSGVEPSAIDPRSLYVGLEHVSRRNMWLSDGGEASEVTSTKSRFAPGDVLFGKLRPYFHKVATAATGGICSTDIIVTRARDQSTASALLAALSSDAVVEAVVAASEGTRMPRTSWKDLAAVEISWPTATQMTQFVSRLDGIRDVALATLEENHTLAATRYALLPQLMSGKLRVRDAEAAASAAGA